MVRKYISKPNTINWLSTNLALAYFVCACRNVNSVRIGYTTHNKTILYQPKACYHKNCGRPSIDKNTLDALNVVLDLYGSNPEPLKAAFKIVFGTDRGHAR